MRVACVRSAFAYASAHVPNGVALALLRVAYFSFCFDRLFASGARTTDKWLNECLQCQQMSSQTDRLRWPTLPAGRRQVPDCKVMHYLPLFFCVN